MPRLNPIFFQTPAQFRNWLETNHLTATELIVGFHKRHTGAPSITWRESVIEALCFGWIDGVRKSLDSNTYTIRFTPRRAKSKWSAVNIKLFRELHAQGRVRPAGLAIFEKRPNPESPGYTTGKHHAELDEASTKRFRANRAAWSYFESQPPGYRKNASWWVMQAKKQETRERRLAKLIDLSANGKRLL